MPAATIACMSRLQDEQQRLYAIGQVALPPDTVRVLVLGLRHPADWAALAPVWQGVQADWQWPEPGIAVNGADAFELWFALADPMRRADAATLAGLVARRYLGQLKPDRVRVWPSAREPGAKAPACPPFLAAPERWAAFITPDLPAVFGDDPALDFEPGEQAQADLLARLRPVDAKALTRAQRDLTVTPASTIAGGTLPKADAMRQPTADLGGSPVSAEPAGGDPRAFLMAVMNDVSVPLALRIEAAKGLLLARDASRS